MTNLRNTKVAGALRVELSSSSRIRIRAGGGESELAPDSGSALVPSRRRATSPSLPTSLSDRPPKLTLEMSLRLCPQDISRALGNLLVVGDV